MVKYKKKRFILKRGRFPALLSDIAASLLK